MPCVHTCLPDPWRSAQKSLPCRRRGVHCQPKPPGKKCMMHIWLHACVHACMRHRVGVCMHECMHACMRTPRPPHPCQDPQACNQIGPRPSQTDSMQALPGLNLKKLQLGSYPELPDVSASCVALSSNCLSGKKRRQRNHLHPRRPPRDLAATKHNNFTCFLRPVRLPVLLSSPLGQEACCEALVLMHACSLSAPSRNIYI